MSTALPNFSNLAFAEELFEQFHRDPAAVPTEWREYFEALEAEEHAQNGEIEHNGNGHKNGNGKNGFRTSPRFVPASIFNPPTGSAEYVNSGTSGQPVTREANAAALQDRVDQLVRAYRVRGHMGARLDPLGLPREGAIEIKPEFYGFTETDLDRLFSCETLERGGRLPLREIIARLSQTYCRYIGVQFMHIDDIRVREWLQARMESTQNRVQLSRDEQVRILTRLTDAVTFEEFLRRKFIGAKSFSLEGAESLVPLLDMAIEKASEQGVEGVMIGMAHRGRLNVLANIMGKSPRAIFREFDDTDPDRHTGRGDVKYHLGYSNHWQTLNGRKVYLALCFNPSHLEYVNPVAIGRMRAKQDRVGDVERTRGLVVLIHGDAAFAGQGVVQETLNLSQLRGYTVGGTLHVVVNNQIGFTTSPSESRSSPYATDIARLLQIPIFHVNGEDPEAVAQVVRVAMDFRAKFKRDVVIDMYCFRRLGHNEADEPSFTQPQMYKAIAERPSTRESYLKRLVKMGGLTREEGDEIDARRRGHLEKELSEARSQNFRLPTHGASDIWEGYVGGPETDVKPVKTAVKEETLMRLLSQLSTVPEGFNVHPKIARILKNREAMARGEVPLDWAAGEALAFATLATEGARVRLSGQDCERGTFSHRHAVLHDVDNGNTYFPLQNLDKDQAPVEILNSPLSEVGVLGFEYGYSQDYPDALVMWEAQFGDFWNAAQVIVDQFIVSAEDKWHRLSGLVMLLPHGMEGMGPEHSSARLERFMLLAAEDNIQIVNPTTPAQIFHLLRRQIVSPWRKPLVVMTPKSLLRHIEAVSPLEDFSKGAFRKILHDKSGLNAEGVSKVILCSGKIYYELDKKREDLKRHDVAILRVEQLYPLRDEEIAEALAPYGPDVPVVWVQEEPANMGALPTWIIRFGESICGHPFSGVSRAASASPATGSASSHKQEQEQVLNEAFS
ncbi:MAG TPA: 2-oxoglutarate dehydrogenase E1 component [Abditibacteriaceae bacterium]